MDDSFCSGYKNDEVREALNEGFNAEGEDAIDAIKENVQISTTSLHQENERQKGPIEMVVHPNDVVHDTIPTPLPPLASTHRRNVKHI